MSLVRTNYWAAWSLHWSVGRASNCSSQAGSLHSVTKKPFSLRWITSHNISIHRSYRNCRGAKSVSWRWFGTLKDRGVLLLWPLGFRTSIIQTDIVKIRWFKEELYWGLRKQVTGSRIIFIGAMVWLWHSCRSMTILLLSIRGFFREDFCKDRQLEAE